jgi:hypothetical protein
MQTNADGPEKGASPSIVNIQYCLRTPIRLEQIENKE